MSIFEFVLTPLAIIIGFGISEILRGWGQQIHNRHLNNSHTLQISCSALILFFSLVYLWSMWLIRDIVWTFPLFLLLAIPGYAVALAAYISSLDTSVDAPPILDQYFHNSRPIYGLLALFPLSAMTSFLLTGTRELIAGTANLAVVTTILITLLALFITLAWSRSQRYHLAAMGFLWILLNGLVIGLGVT
jgi:hypothetical protein